MPLVLDAETYSPEMLRELLDQQREGLREILPRLEVVPEGYRDPSSLRAASDLVAGALRAVELLDGPDADRSELAAAVNLAYAAMVVAIDLMKTHSGGPIVPKGRRPAKD